MVYAGKKKLLKQSKILYLRRFLESNRCVVFFDVSGSDYKSIKSFFVSKSLFSALVVGSSYGALLDNIRGGRLFAFISRDASYPKEIKFPLFQILDGLPCADMLESVSLLDFLQTVSGIVGLVDCAIYDLLLFFDGVDCLNNNILK